MYVFLGSRVVRNLRHRLLIIVKRASIRRLDFNSSFVIYIVKRYTASNLPKCIIYTMLYNDFHFKKAV